MKYANGQAHAEVPMTHSEAQDTACFQIQQEIFRSRDGDGDGGT